LIRIKKTRFRNN